MAARLPGPPRVLQQDPSSLAEVLEDLDRLGAAAGIEPRAAAVRAELEARLEAVRAAVAGARAPARRRPRVARPALRRRPLAARDGRARGRRRRRRPAPARSRPRSPGKRLEALRARGRRRHALRLVRRGSRARRPTSTAERIAALGAERVFAVDAASTYSRPGPRLVDGVELLAHLFHPELVAAPPEIGFTRLAPPAEARAPGAQSSRS